MDGEIIMNFKNSILIAEQIGKDLVALNKSLGNPVDFVHLDNLRHEIRGFLYHDDKLFYRATYGMITGDLWGRAYRISNMRQDCRAGKTRDALGWMGYTRRVQKFSAFNSWLQLAESADDFKSLNNTNMTERRLDHGSYSAGGFVGVKRSLYKSPDLVIQAEWSPGSFIS